MPADFPPEPDEWAPLPTEPPPRRIRTEIAGQVFVLHFWGSDCNDDQCGSISMTSWKCDDCGKPATPLYRFETNPW